MACQWHFNFMKDDKLVFDILNTPSVFAFVVVMDSIPKFDVWN